MNTPEAHSTTPNHTRRPQPSQPRSWKHEFLALGLAVGVSLAGVAVGGVGAVGLSGLMDRITPKPPPRHHVRLAAFGPKPVIAEQLALRGREVFQQACATCHSGSGLGKPGLGKSLVHSDFVADRADEALAAFIIKGRDANDPLNTTKIPMPPKGGVDTLTEEDIRAVVHYLRCLQDPRRMPPMPVWTAPVVVVSAADKAAALAAAGGDAELAGYIQSGNTLFHQTCISCHGRSGAGIKGNGKALARNEFIKSLDDDALLAFIKQGRGPSDPKSTTGIQMPPKGGNPALSDDDLLDIIAYLRTLQGDAPAAVSGK